MDIICEYEIQAGYMNKQTKIFLRQLLDFRTRLLMGKTHFGKTLAKWSHDNISQGCKVCLKQGYFYFDEILHRLNSCPCSDSIIQHIKRTLTKQKFITPVHILFTNRRCTNQVNMAGKMFNAPIKNILTVLSISKINCTKYSV